MVYKFNLKICKEKIYWHKKQKRWPNDLKTSLILSLPQQCRKTKKQKTKKQKKKELDTRRYNWEPNINKKYK